MRLLAGLILRIALVAFLCLAAAMAWVMVESDRGIRAEVEASADRVVRDMRFLAWHELTWRGRDARLVSIRLPEPVSAPWLRLISPGVCIAVARSGGESRPAARPEAMRPACGAWGAVGPAAPAWFEALVERAFGRVPSVSRAVMVNGREVGLVTGGPDADASVRQIWQRVRVSVGVAAAMAAAISVLASILIGWALRPTQMIVDGLKRLEQPGRAVDLPRFRTVEFDHIARAVEALGRRLADLTAERTSLTRRLFAVQEEERRAIARDLHDEFGQCLTATEALAASIAAGAGDRPDLAEDARAIARTATRMMATLRGALAHLRPPDLDEIGLEASLRRLVAGRGGATPACRLEIAGTLAAMPAQVGLTLYRVAQEGLTNALRHGRPQRVTVRLERTDDAAVTLTVEDDGGGDPSGLAAATGQGILGIRERVSAHGGRLSIDRAEGGLRLRATLPLFARLPDIVGDGAPA